MMASAIFQVQADEFLSKALSWSQGFDQLCLFESNGFQSPYAQVERMLAVGAQVVFTPKAGASTFEQLAHFKSRYPDSWIPGFLSYDLKNELEELQTQHPNRIGFPDAYFFVPRILIQFEKNQVNISSEIEDPAAVYQQIISHHPLSPSYTFKGQVKARMSQAEYFKAFYGIKNHIQLGDIYEANLCQEFYDDEAFIDHPEALFLRLNSLSPTPFACLFKIEDAYILSASPERFLAKRGSTLISQPIKGTSARGKDEQEDARLKEQLLNNPKEIAENVMIVDLVRNDMTRSAVPGTVRVTEKLGLYTFKHVHQLISTISCEKDPALSDCRVIQNTFPAGSMTGAPKISAMQLCDQYENSRRGVYSGAIGYFAPTGDFDFNVVIRTILYNRSKQYLSFHTGGAITMDAEAEKEYAECMTKASAILSALGQSL